MPRRRAQGYVFRRRQTASRHGGQASPSAYRPGWYLRVREGGREVVRYAGPDRETALDLAARLAREADRKELLGEVPVSEILFEAFAEEYLRFGEQTQPRRRSGRTRV